MIKILIADDEPLARARIKRLLATDELCTVIGEASNGEQVIELCKQLQPDLVMLDINMPKQSGLEVAAELKQFSIPPAVMFLTAHPEYALTAFELAVDGYLVKPVSEQALTKAIAQLSKLNRTQVLTPENNYICYQLAGVLRRVNIDDVMKILKIIGQVEKHSDLTRQFVVRDSTTSDPFSDTTINIISGSSYSLNSYLLGDVDGSWLP